MRGRFTYLIDRQSDPATSQRLDLSHANPFPSSSTPLERTISNTSFCEFLSSRMGLLEWSEKEELSAKSSFFNVFRKLKSFLKVPLRVIQT
ncbi:hypothetical protein CDAR_512741 [Caerostris darwini]|uniref:Maturase K n=1 Tax=Caerostris darwini TaxID=1538125 RepID=A0AAV4S8M7_9ARAC|nr:hypothetical protein CDAR_512741 [Caerostris darwini]